MSYAAKQPAERIRQRDGGGVETVSSDLRETPSLRFGPTVPLREEVHMTITDEEFNSIVRLTPLVSIDLIIRNPQGEILLGLRKKEPAKETWFVPGGRIRKDDDDLPAAFVRISEGELKITLELGDAEFLGPFVHRYDTNAAEDEEYGTYYIVLAYQVGLDLDTTKLPMEQHSDWKWFSLDDMNADCSVHKNVKDYFKDLAKIPAAFDDDSQAGPIQYQLVAARRQGHDAMLWQTPAISLAAQAFLFTIVLDPDTTPGTRFVVGSLAFVTALVSIHLMTKHRYFEEVDRDWLEQFEIRHRASGFRRLHGKPSYPRGRKAWFVRRSAYDVWRLVLWFFALAALVATFFPKWGFGWIQVTTDEVCAAASMPDRTSTVHIPARQETLPPVGPSVTGPDESGQKDRAGLPADD